MLVLLVLLGATLLMIRQDLPQWTAIPSQASTPTADSTLTQHFAAQLNTHQGKVVFIHSKMSKMRLSLV
ncbi:MAG: hypothetical protein Q4C68_01520 [Moraxella sp.]|nr:hypothetical protein [Moraxella sp.]